ncbi:M3 family metallopeptidase [Arthrobacter sp. H14]|uniref:M3 family metallopeptidase n=1 Tax=Arthrobacter sp. H14 TaxID=1312959 RepID=UPI00047EFD42|nr:M3 family metallopeptidase [Arthrobacter sp. H14]
MTNPFIGESPLPYQLPPFDQIHDEHFLPAFEAGIGEHQAEVEAIVSNTEPAGFANTVAALEKSGRTLQRVSAVFFNLASSHATGNIQQIQSEISPRLAEHQDSIYLNKELYQRFTLVDPDLENLDAESRRLFEEYLRAFTRSGAQLQDRAKQRLRELNSQLSRLSTQFSQLVMNGANASALLVEKEAELEGLSGDDIASAAEAARTGGHEGKYMLSLVLPTNQPAMASLANRETRRRLFDASVRRGTRDDEFNSLGIAKTMAQLRAERAELLGFENHASYAANDQTAPSLAAIHTMMDRLAPAAVHNAKAEAGILADVAGHDLEPWDWAFYSEQVRRDKYDVDLAALRPYFELERVLQDGVFYAANRLYGLTFEEWKDLPGYHPDVRIWEVKEEDGTALGLFLGDYYTRDTKNGGAWMNPLVEQSALFGTRAVVVNNLNIPKPPAGEPTLMTYDQVTTMFHEFGHALHGLFSDVSYPKFSGTSVPRDFVEYPSQVNEMWILWPEILANYAKHYRTGEALPQESIDKLVAAQQWGEGFATTEYLGAALLDLAWHELAPGTEITDSLAFEAEALERAGVALNLIPPRYRTGYFKHIFAGGYAAGYYSYIWSEVMDADTVEWFKANGGLTRGNGDHFRKELLSTGFSIDPLEAFRNFRGRDAEIAPLLKRRGLE